MKKLLSILIAATMLISTFASFTAYGTGDVETNTNENEYYDDFFDNSSHISADGLYKYEFVYEPTGGVYGLRILDYLGEVPSCLEIPDFVDGYDVQEISERTFYNLNNLESVIKKYGLLHKNAFKDCKNLKYAEFTEYLTLEPKAIGYYKGGRIRDFTIKCHSKNWFNYDDSAKTPVYYAYDNDFKCNYNVKSTAKKTIKYRAGISFKMLVDNQTAKNWKSSNPKVAKITSKGKVTLLKKGKVTLTAKLKNGKSYSRKLEVTSNPKLENSKGAVRSIKVIKGETKKLKITGKANSINNSYKNTKYAKITSKKFDKKITIKGLKKGTTTLQIKVNGVVLKLKVKVK